MANEHIGRLQKIGLGRESTAGTAVAASAWLPKVSAEFKPVSEKAVDSSAYGVIDEVYDSQTVKNMTEISLSGILRDKNIGLLLLATMGGVYKTVRCTITGLSGGTPAIGDSVTNVAHAMTGTIRYIANSYYYIQVLTGTLTATSNGDSFGNGTWTATIGGVDNAIFTHIFYRANTNTHQSLSVVNDDPVSPMVAAYSMLDSLELEVANNSFLTFAAKLKGKKLAVASPTSSFITDNPFMGKNCTVKFADTTALLTAASAVELSRIKLSFKKNVADYQALGSDDVSSLHNQQFNVAGDLDALFNSTTFRDYMINSTKKACRIRLLNTGVTIGSAGNPELMIDMARQSFRDWGSSSDNNGLRTQTMGFDGEFSTTDAFTTIILLTNAQSTAYDA